MKEHISISPVVRPAALASVGEFTDKKLLNDHEADLNTDKKLMHIPEQNFIQRKCAHCEEEEKAHRKPLLSFIQKKETGNNNSVASDSISNQIQSTKDGGSSLSGTTRSFMDSRFGTDFSNVKIHTDNHAVQLSKELNAQAFTVGNDIYFNNEKYKPESFEGKKLLAHELTHTLQQSGEDAQRSTNKTTPVPQTYIARFTDDAHHIIDEAGLTGGGFTEDQIKDIETGNKLRDYSQLPRFGNAILLCNPGKFGGYSQAEHFDNYIWDREKNEWRDRTLLANQRTGLVDANVRGSDPIAHIKSKLASFIKLGLTKDGLNELGIAFHAVEDFFAHSNFIELINKDYRFGHELVTGSVPGTESVSLLHTMEDVSTKESAAYYKASAEEAKKDTDILSHANIAKDHRGDRNHIEARRLAALTVQDLSRDLLQIVNLPAGEKMKSLESVVFAKIDRYLRLPDMEKDAWWTQLITADNGAIDKLLSKAESDTPATVNQCFLSPLRNLEASKDSNMKIIFGAAIPVTVLGSRGFLQVGAGLVTPLDLDNATITSDRNDKPAWFVGGQLTIPLNK